MKFLALPPPTVAIYSILNLSSSFVVLFLIHLSIFQDWRSLFITVIPFLVTGAIITLINWPARQLIKNSIPASDNIKEVLARKFPTFASYIQFYMGPVPDTRVVTQGGVNYCILKSDQCTILELGETKEPEGTRKVFAIVAHEVGHIFSRDASDFKVCAGLTIAGSVWMIFAWIAFFYRGAHFHPSMVFGLVYLFTIQIYAVYYAIRIREYFADSISAYIYNYKDILDLINDYSKSEPYIDYPLSYRITHPTFRERLSNIQDFTLAYRFTIHICVIVAAAFAILDYGHKLLLISYGTESAAALEEHFGSFVAAIPRIIITNSLWVLISIVCFHVVFPAALTNQLTARLLFWRLLQLGCLIQFNYCAIGAGVYGDIARIFSAFNFENLISIFNIWGMMLIYYALARYINSFEGQKKIKDLFLLKVAILGGLSWYFLSQIIPLLLGLFVLSVKGKAFFDPTGATKVILNILLFVLFWSLARRKIRKNVKLWSGQIHLRKSQFLHEEWVADYGIGRAQSARMNFIQVLMLILIFVFGLYYVTLWSFVHIGQSTQDIVIPIVVWVRFF